MAGDSTTSFALPFELDFDRTRGGVVDKDGQSTGFTYVQPNSLGNEYQPSLIDLAPGEGLLKITSSGNATAGGNFGADNTLTNGLQMQFYAGKAWTMSARLKGPLSYINKPAEQGGIMFGPDQENYVKLVAASTPDGMRLQFIDEQKISGGYRRSLGASGVMTNIGNFANIQTLDLILSGDPATRTIRAYYRVNGRGLIKINGELVLDADKGAAFFSTEFARAGLIVMHKNNEGPVTVAFDRFEVKRGGPALSRPDVTATRPANGAVNVVRDTFIAADVFLPNPGQGINPNTLTSRTVKLYRTSDGVDIPATRNTSAAGDALVLQPGAPLAANTTYTFAVTAGLEDTSGQPFFPYTATFTTGTTVGSGDSGVSFDKVGLPTAMNQSFSGVTMGPDNRLYATTLTGHIFRYDILADGSLSDPFVVNTVRQRNGGPRFITGLEFDPASTAQNPIVWITHGQAVYENATDFTGKISRLAGANLQFYTDMVVGLPRSIRDHLTNQLKFGPKNKLFFMQGSNSALGAPDNAWGLREEHVLNAAVLVADTRALVRRAEAGEGPLDVSVASYDPFSPIAPLGIWATGVRNAYDLVWHSNGQLYVPTNGSAAGGATPATPAAPFAHTNRIDFTTNGPYTGPEVPGISRVNETQDDYLFRVEYGGYYGHPNPARSEYVLNGGNPTSGVDRNEVPGYPVGTLPDRNYRGSIFNFGKNVSPNGAIEYRSAEFGGQLQGQLLVVRYSGGDDIIALKLDEQGSVTGQTTITSQLSDPLDLIEDRRNGNLYVVEHGAARITLLRPGVASTAPKLTLNTTRRVFNDVRGGEASRTGFFRITNRGNANLVIPAGGITLTGTHADQFEFTSRPGGEVTLVPGQSLGIGVAFDPSTSTSIGIKDARVNIVSNDPDTPLRQVRVRGFAMGGLGGSNEPSLQRVLELYNLPVNVGDSDPSTVALDNPPTTPKDEVALQRMVKAGPGPVTIEPMAVFGLESNPAVEFGYYEPGTPTGRTRLFEVATSDFQSVTPIPLGATQFDPGSAAFAFYAVWPGKKNPDGTSREGFSEDVLNLWEPDPSLRHKVRFYPLKNPNGTVVANAYIMAHEEAEGVGDSQDLVAVIRNVTLAPGGTGPELGLTNLAGAPYADRLVFNKIGKLNETIPNEVHNLNKVRIRNTGGADLLVNSLVITGRYELVNPPAAGTVVAPGAFVDVTVRFTANSGSIHNGTLVINSNDADEAQKVVKLAGFWQTQSEGDREPTLPQVGQILGYGTVFVYAGQQLNTNGLFSAVGDEVLSEYWKRADPHQPVTVRQLAAFHTQGEKTTVNWHRKGSSKANTLFTHARADGQRLFPRDDVSGEPTVGRFNPGSDTFGFVIDDAWSDRSKNPQEVDDGNHGHSVRFYPARDREGEFIPNTWLMVMDYFGVNYDYNDNVYLIDNMRPELLPPTPRGVSAFQDSQGVRIDWADNRNDDLLGYYVFRSNNGNGGFRRLNNEPISDSQFLDQAITDGSKAFYRVMAVNTDGTTSVVASAATPGIA
ncbi:MAG TPA: choice-of-anchor D domain-containing protein [Tepidisphaeraceae bacterium]|nr:choice-of-anchor D domain-containing protein [Tepidisphaeraceae bacterium]